MPTGIIEWLAPWKARDWRTADRMPVNKSDLRGPLEAAGLHGSPSGARSGAIAGGERLANRAIDALVG